MYIYIDSSSLDVSKNVYLFLFVTKSHYMVYREKRLRTKRYRPYT